jgi:nucleoside-diphosphate-sugar epimerase
VISRRVLIVGDPGFVGAHLARRCVADGHEVHVLAGTNGTGSAGADPIAVHRVALDDPAAVLGCLDRVVPEYIFDCTGDRAGWHRGPLADRVAMGKGIRRLTTLIRAASLCREPPRAFIRTGSIAEYGAGPVPYREQQREQPDTADGVELVAKTQLAAMIAPSLPFRLATARLALVYGAGQDPRFLIPSLVGANLLGQPSRVCRRADRHDVLHVSDAVAALVRLAEEPPAPGAIVNVGSDTSVAVDELAVAIARITDKEPRWDRDEQFDAVEQRMSIERIVAGWGWVPRMTLARGLAEVVAEQREAALTVAA